MPYHFINEDVKGSVVNTIDTLIGENDISDPIVMDDAFLYAAAGVENGPLFERYMSHGPSVGIRPFKATGDAPGRMEIGFGLTYPEETPPTGMETVGQAFEELKTRYKGLIDKIAARTRFSNIKEMPSSYQRILVSIADNVGLTGLDAYKKLQSAMKEGNKGKIYDEMLTKVKVTSEGGDVTYSPLSTRRDKIFSASGL